MKRVNAGISMLSAAIAMSLELGCAPRVVTVGALDVTPGSTVPLHGRGLALALAPATPDATRVEARGFPVVEVRAFRTTLQRAFERTFGPSPASTGWGSSDAILQLEVTDIAFVTPRDAHARRLAGEGAFDAEIVLAHGSTPPMSKPNPRRTRYAQFRFAASLREGGVEVARLVGLATAETATEGGADSVAASLRSAVAVLYRRIARELLLRRTAGAWPQEL